MTQKKNVQPLGKKMARRLTAEEINQVTGADNAASLDDPSQGCPNSRSCTTVYLADLPDCD